MIVVKKSSKKITILKKLWLFLGDDFFAFTHCIINNHILYHTFLE